MWNKDEVKGKTEQVKGAAKDKVGELTGDPVLEAEGEAERVVGKVRETAGTVRRKTEEVVNDVRKKISE